MRAYLKHEDGHWRESVSTTEILDHDGPMVEICDGDSQDDAIERIESSEGQKAIKSSYENNGGRNSTLLFFERRVYNSIDRGLHDRHPTEADFEGGETVRITSRTDFILMRLDGKRYYVPRNGTGDCRDSMVGIEDAAGDIICRLDPDLASCLNDRRLATATKVRAKLCKPKVVKPRLVKEPELRSLTYQLVTQLNVSYGYGSWAITRKWCVNELVMASVILSATETPEAMHEVIRPLSVAWMGMREENVKRFSSMYGGKRVERLDGIFASVPVIVEEEEPVEEAELVA